MSPKAHGTTETAVQKNLRWGCDRGTADRICSYNRHFAEYAGYWKNTDFLDQVDRKVETIYYDSVTGKPLFVAPRGRSMEAFLKESNTHGWPSFRQEEVVWENVRVLRDGETVSVDGTHLGHNLPDSSGNRCEPRAFTQQLTHLLPCLEEWAPVPQTAVAWRVATVCINLVSVAGLPVDASKTEL